MSILKYFKTTPGRPMGGDRGPVARGLADRTPVAPIGRPGGIFEFFQNGHIFLKF